MRVQAAAAKSLPNIRETTENAVGAVSGLVSRLNRAGSESPLEPFYPLYQVHVGHLTLRFISSSDTRSQASRAVSHMAQKGMLYIRAFLSVSNLAVIDSYALACGPDRSSPHGA